MRCQSQFFDHLTPLEAADFCSTECIRTVPTPSTGRLGCVFQCAAETTFYVIAVYFGSVKIKNTRYALSTMLLIDLICVCAAIFVCLAFFQL